MTCCAKQAADQMVCGCGNRWDVNDPNPPMCLPLSQKVESRPSFDQWAMQLAEVTALRATCTRRKVGAVIFDAHGYILSTGYNGPPAGMPHCTDEPCEGAHCASGTGLDLCQSLHAEQNAIARLRSPLEAHTMYVTTAPCVSCTKLTLATSIKRIVFKSDYPTSGKMLWIRTARDWQQL